MDKTSICAVREKGEEEEREKASFNARTPGDSFPKVHAWLQMLTIAISAATANPKIFHKSIIYWKKRE